METSVNERIDMIIQESGLTLTAFARKIGVAQSSLRDCVINGAEPKYSTLYKIIKANPNISHTWFMTGEGDMLNDGVEADGALEINGVEMNEPIEAILQIHLKGNRKGKGFSLNFSGGTLEVESK